MAHATNNNPSADASLPETKYIDMVKHVINIRVLGVLEELRLSERSIYKVPCTLRKVKEEAYTPLCISIGPIHLGKQELEPMQEHKLRYFQFFLKRVSYEAMKTYKHYLETNEKQIRQCYAEKFPGMAQEKFVDMMLLDAVFIMELLLRNCELKSQSFKHEQKHKESKSFRGRNSEDLIMTQSWLSRNITRDLILIENQIPFFVLQKLYDDVVTCVKEKEEQHTSFVDLTIEYFAFYDSQMSSLNENETKKHYFCGLLRKSKSKDESPKPFTVVRRSGSEEPCISKSEDNGSKETCKSENKNSCCKPEHFTDLIRWFYLPTECNIGHADQVLRTATKLQDSGVSFEKDDMDGRLLDITFDKTPILSSFLCFGCSPLLNQFKARVRIPQLKVDHNTECIFRNLIAFEQCHYPEKPYICNYVSLIDSLIHTQLDVELLVEKEVIVHELGSHKDVASLVNGLCKHVVTNSTCYSDTINKLNDHYMNDWNHTVAALRLVYFRDLWRASGTVVGIVVLVFAVFQFLRVWRYLF
ncbi:hypothetical protein AAZX31_07G105700 [Glycine max]|uniref:Uncharacterized protein n=1 Tax=Glycine max TaxID=3847 RepID=K7L1A5_SOYBN|nr:UPF0481 protein At3g47200 [Glycine max]XP_006583543.1 UPF0481 protein At3g47200 [Glycine max]KAG4400691.1 hypothetical protein GLYMA_07G111400v4 [Glycine max]KAG4400692.1 hypothetical protein GLYMA_07G111400v4 [Glycine max]KAG5037389.1 hypothetical protein JHK86_018229 [Glycine max]KAH1086352.1 hypothetical protein GYH30_018051 [Glycine max]KAH1086353.1 hypothetical protein GYH30_018051 [Glycine max]|eukprot:XP_003530155.1 UPF0481 protein At3g47200 [Glycine max]